MGKGSYGEGRKPLSRKEFHVMLEINPPMREGVMVGFDFREWPSRHRNRWRAQWEDYEDHLYDHARHPHPWGEHWNKWGYFDNTITPSKRLT